MVCGCFTALEPRRLAVIDTTVNSAPYQKILKVNPRPSAEVREHPGDTAAQ